MTDIKDNELFSFSTASGIIVLFISILFWSIGQLISIYLLKDGISGLCKYLVIHIPYVFLFLSLYLGSNFILKTKLMILITGRRKYRILYSVEVALIYLLFLIVISLINHKNIELNPSSLTYKLSFLIPVLILTPMQSLSEEILFRALPARIIYKDNLKPSVLASILSGIVFVIPHLGNIELTRGTLYSILYYFVWGSLALSLALYTRGFEAPVAMHIANNLYIALIVNYKNGSMPTSALFVDTTENIGFSVVLEALVIFAIIFAFSRKVLKD